MNASAGSVASNDASTPPRAFTSPRVDMISPARPPQDARALKYTYAYRRLRSSD